MTDNGLNGSGAFVAERLREVCSSKIFTVFVLGGARRRHDGPQGPRRERVRGGMRAGGDDAARVGYGPK